MKKFIFLIGSIGATFASCLDSGRVLAEPALIASYPTAEVAEALSSTEKSDNAKAQARAQQMAALLLKPHQLFLKARFNAKAPDRFIPGPSRLEWQQEAHEGQCTIFLPLFRKPVMSYAFSEKLYAYSDFQGRSFEADSPESLFKELHEEIKEFPVLPFENLPYWAFGVAAPKLSIANCEYDAQKRLLALHQSFEGDEWEIRFAYSETDDWPVPKEISLTHLPSQFKYRVNLTEFELDQALYDAFLALEPL